LTEKFDWRLVVDVVILVACIGGIVAGAAFSLLALLGRV
jgi:hypothetical protein